MKHTGWMREVFSLELRKLLSYRSDFWIQMIGPTVGNLALAYFLWRALFDSSGAQSIGGYTFGSMMLYSLLVSQSMRVVMDPCWRTDIATEIYDGGLTRYLIYPLPYFGYKATTHFALALVGAVQMLLTLGLFALIFPVPEGSHLNFVTVGAGLATCFLASYLAFLMMSGMELVAFWADSVWSLQVLFKFLLNLLGGALVPLSFFPGSVRELFTFLPFPFLISVPVRTFMGLITWQEWLSAFGVAAVWALLVGGAVRLVWRRGLKQYSGVGI